MLKTPYMDKLASMGRTGRLKTVADGFHPGSEVANNQPKDDRTRNEIEKMGCPFTGRTSVNKRQRRNPRKWIRR